MSIRIWLPAVLFAVLAASPAVSANTEPAGQIDRLVLGFVEAFNSGDHDAMTAFYQDGASKSFKERRTEQESLENQLTALEQAKADIEEKVDTCFENENEALAKSFIKKRLETQHREGHLDSYLVRIKKAQEKLNTVLKEQHIKLETLKEKVDTLSVSPGQSESAAISDEEIEVAFLKEKNLRTRETSKGAQNA